MATVDKFLLFWNYLHPSIKFTMETEEGGLPVLDELVYRREDGT